MPAAANLARFDQQADVAQMGALILAVLLRRPLRAHEYPRGVSDLVVTATESSTALGSPGSASALRMWLQEALQIHPRLAFRSAVESQRSFVDIGSAAGSRCGGAMALQVLLRTTCGEPLNQLPVVVNAPMRPASESAVAVTGAGRATEPLRFDPALGFPETLEQQLRGELHDAAIALARFASEKRIADKRGSAERGQRVVDRGVVRPIHHVERFPNQRQLSRATQPEPARDARIERGLNRQPASVPCRVGRQIVERVAIPIDVAVDERAVRLPALQRVYQRELPVRDQPLRQASDDRRPAVKCRSSRRPRAGDAGRCCRARVYRGSVPAWPASRVRSGRRRPSRWAPAAFRQTARRYTPSCRTAAAGRARVRERTRRCRAIGRYSGTRTTRLRPGNRPPMLISTGRGSRSPRAKR